MKNILITSAGRRVELLRAFRDSLDRHGLSAKVHAGDLRPSLSAACQDADRSTALPAATSPDYIDYLREYCLEHDIGLVVPTIDPELLPLARAHREMRQLGIELVVSDVELIEHCADKSRTGSLFANAGLRYPKIYSPPDIPFPCFVKPRSGSSSVGARALASSADLDARSVGQPDLLFMELIPSSFSEYTVDAYFNQSSELLCSVPRKRIEVRAGEVSKGITRKNFVFDAVRERFAKLPGARGCITIQLFENEGTQEIVGLEINPRFGGGFPLAYAAGAAFPRWLIDEYLRDRSPSRFDDWADALLMLRYDAKVLVRDADF